MTAFIPILLSSVLLSLSPEASPEPSPDVAVETAESGQVDDAEPPGDGPVADEIDAAAPDAEAPDDAPIADEPVAVDGAPPDPEAPSDTEPLVDEAPPDPEPVADEPISDPFVEQAQATPQPPAPTYQREPPRQPMYGPWLFGAGISAGRSSVGLGASLTRFVIPHIGLGADLDETVYFGGGNGGAFNDFAIAGHVWVLFAPYGRVTPYVRGGLGGEFFSHKLGAYGLWKGGGGLVMLLGRQQRINVRLGAEVIGRFPDDRFSENFTCGLTTKPCSLTIRPEIGIGIRFGKSRS